jgi:hypothetical protein
MATYFLNVKRFSRGKGARVTRAAALIVRANESAMNEAVTSTTSVIGMTLRTRKSSCRRTWEQSSEMSWARDRAKLWNPMEHAATRRNALLAREILVLLPPELSVAQRVALVRTFSREIAGKYRNAVHCAIHFPRPGSDSRHHHAHLLMTTREVGLQGIGARTSLELSGTERRLRGLGPSKQDYLQIRERWAQAAYAVAPIHDNERTAQYRVCGHVFRN